MTNQVVSDSLVFAHREVVLGRARCERAFQHLYHMTDLQIAPAITLASHHLNVAIGNYRGAIAKRSREILTAVIT